MQKLARVLKLNALNADEHSGYALGRILVATKTQRDKFCTAEMYRLLLETPRHPESSGQPVDWDSLFGGLSATPPYAAQPAPAQPGNGQAGHVWPGAIIRGPSQDFTIECATPPLFPYNARLPHIC